MVLNPRHHRQESGAKRYADATNHLVLTKAIDEGRQRSSYKVQLGATFLAVEIVALQVRQGDDEVDQDEEDAAGVQEAEGEEEDVAEERHRRR